MARPIGEWFQVLRDAGVKAATLLGKGPSLDLYSPVEGAYVMGVNDVPLCQRCDAVFWVDGVFMQYDYLGVDVIRRMDRRESQGGRGYYYEKWRPDNPDSPAAVPRNLVPRNEERNHTGIGVGSYALAMLALAGVERVTCWGFDGGIPALDNRMGYAECLGGKSPVSQPGKNSVVYVKYMIQVCEQPWSSITLLEHGTADGMMTLWEKPCQSADTSSTCAVSA